MKQFQGTEGGFYVAVFKCANHFQTVPDILVYGFETPELSAEWLRSYLDRLGLLSRAYLVE